MRNLKKTPYKLLSFDKNEGMKAATAAAAA